MNLKKMRERMDKNRVEYQLLKFGLVGVLNTVVDYGVFTLLTLLFRMDSIISHIISYICGMTNSYFLNRYWTFKLQGRGSNTEILRFIFVNLLSLVTSALVLKSLQTQAGLSVYLAKVGAIICSMAVNFTGSKLVVFRD